MNREALDRECRVFCLYLVGRIPNDYVMRKYREAHQSQSLRVGAHANPCESLLVRIARLNPLGTKLIDAYSRVFRPLSLIRRKLILILAIMESCAPTHASVDSPDSTSVPLLLVRSLQRGLTFALSLLIGVLAILPLEMLLRARTRSVVSRVSRHG